MKNNSSNRRFLIRNHGSQKEVAQHFQELKENCLPRILYPVKISFRNEEDIKISPRWKKTKRIITSRSILKEWLKEFLPTEKRNLGTSARRKNTICKCMGKNTRCSLFFWIFSTIFHSCSKNYIIIILSVCRRNI